MKRSETSPTYLIAWLQGQPTSPWHGKVTKASIKRILDLRENLTEVLAEVERLPFTTRMEDRLPRLDKLILKLNEQLSLYASTPTFTLYDGRSWGIDDALDTYQRIPIGESLAARTLCGLAYERALERVRVCVCGSWFYASRVHQISCSTACRKTKHQKTDTFKQKRRLYMRAYYALKQSGKVK